MPIRLTTRTNINSDEKMVRMNTSVYVCVCVCKCVSQSRVLYLGGWMDGCCVCVCEKHGIVRRHVAKFVVDEIFHNYDTPTTL